MILTPFNYHVGYNKGVELTTSYDKGPFSYYGNLAIGEAEGRGDLLRRNSISRPPTSPTSRRIRSTPTTASSMTASAGMSYLWQGTRCSVDIIAGTGLRTTTATGAPNEETVPSYEQVNLGVSHTFELPYGGPLEVRLRRDQRARRGLSHPQPAAASASSHRAYGPRRTFFVGVRKDF